MPSVSLETRGPKGHWESKVSSPDRAALGGAPALRGTGFSGNDGGERSEVHLYRPRPSQHLRGCSPVGHMLKEASGAHPIHHVAVLAAWPLQRVRLVACLRCFPLPPAGSLGDRLSLYLILSEAGASLPGLLSGLILQSVFSFPSHLGHPIINSFLPPSLGSPVSAIPFLMLTSALDVRSP